MVLPGRPGGRVARRWDLNGRRRARASSARVLATHQARAADGRFDCEEASFLALRRNLRAFAALLALAGVACAHRDWHRALEQDTAAAYHQFLRAHPGNGHAPEARARLD